jgi:uncharacterized protein (DUF433 family)
MEKQLVGDGTMKLPEFLTAHPDGEVRLRGTRISLVEVVDLYNEGYSPQKIYEEFLSPSLDQINQVIAFYLANRVDVDTYVRQYHAEIVRNSAQYQASPAMRKVRRLWEVLEEADSKSPSDPQWTTLPLAEKIRRLHLLDDPSETA